MSIFTASKTVIVVVVIVVLVVVVVDVVADVVADVVVVVVCCLLLKHNNNRSARACWCHSNSHASTCTCIHLVDGHMQSTHQSPSPSCYSCNWQEWYGRPLLPIQKQHARQYALPAPAPLVRAAL